MKNKTHDLTLELISDLIDTKLAALKQNLLEEIDKRMGELVTLRQWKTNVQRMMHNDVLKEPELISNLFKIKFDN